MVQVFDDAMLTDYMSTMLGQSLSGWQAHKGDSVAEALSKVGATCELDVPTAIGTVDEYNSFVDAQADPHFSRTNLIGTDGALRRIGSPPFYAMVTVPGTTHFNGGLKVDADMRVIDHYDTPISRLYAAGEVTGGFHGSGYMSASHLGSSLIFGRRAGIIASANS
jgi:fumarate reductase flavoprotein subunit